jgi:hypothetical protein
MSIKHLLNDADLEIERARVPVMGWDEFGIPNQ